MFPGSLSKIQKYFMSSLLVEKLIRAFWQYTLLGYLIANVFQNQISSDTRASATQKGDRVITEDWCWCHWKQHLHCFQCKIWYCISWSLELFCELDYGPCISGNVDSRNTEKHSINFKNEWTSLQVILCWETAGSCKTNLKYTHSWIKSTHYTAF